jgi:hypothetical protein
VTWLAGLLGALTLGGIVAAVRVWMLAMLAKAELRGRIEERQAIARASAARRAELDHDEDELRAREAERIAAVLARSAEAMTLGRDEREVRLLDAAEDSER